MTNTNEKKWHFTRRWEVTYRSKTGQTYTEFLNEPIDWESHYIEQEIRERIQDYRTIKLEEGWTLFTNQIEAYKATEGHIVKSNYNEDIRYMKVTEEDLMNLGFEGEELEKELKRLM